MKKITIALIAVTVMAGCKNGGNGILSPSKQEKNTICVYDAPPNKPRVFKACVDKKTFNPSNYMYPYRQYVESTSCADCPK